MDIEEGQRGPFLYLRRLQEGVDEMLWRCDGKSNILLDYVLNSAAHECQ